MAIVQSSAGEMNGDFRLGLSTEATNIGLGRANVQTGWSGFATGLPPVGKIRSDGSWDAVCLTRHAWQLAFVLSVQSRMHVRGGKEHDWWKPTKRSPVWGPG